MTSILLLICFICTKVFQKLRKSAHNSFFWTTFLSSRVFCLLYVLFPVKPISKVLSNVFSVLKNEYNYLV